MGECVSSQHSETMQLTYSEDKCGQCSIVANCPPKSPAGIETGCVCMCVCDAKKGRKNALSDGCNTARELLALAVDEADQRQRHCRRVGEEKQEDEVNSA